MVRLTGFLVSLVIFATPIIADAQGHGRGRGGGASNRYLGTDALTRSRHSLGDTYTGSDMRRRTGVNGADTILSRIAIIVMPIRGFSRSYGPLEAYRNNYRAGFRAGYDAGYRDETARRR